MAQDFLDLILTPPIQVEVSLVRTQIIKTSKTQAVDYLGQIPTQTPEVGLVLPTPVVVFLVTITQEVMVQTKADCLETITIRTLEAVYSAEDNKIIIILVGCMEIIIRIQVVVYLVIITINQQVCLEDEIYQILMQIYIL